MTSTMGDHAGITTTGPAVDAAIEKAPLRSIVVGVDGSQGAQRAISWAAARGVELHVEVVAVHVLTYTRELGRDLTLDTMTTWRRRLGTALEGPWTEPARLAGAKVRTVLVEADSVPGGLLATAADEDADLVVLGTHGRGTLADRLLGATTYTVAHRARTPVVIIPVDWVPPVPA